jgi:poly(3-hydroxybutyrate) depolymerase
MHLALRNPFSHLALAAALAAAVPAIAADLQELPALNAAIRESSISGLSSGAFMAVQFGTAWSSTIKGVGAISGGSFYCAQSNLVTAMGACMQGPPPSLRVSTDLADRAAKSGDIDSTDNLKRQQIYLFHGYNDGTVARSVNDALAKFYEHYVGRGGKGHIFYQTTLGAGHAFVVTDAPQTADLNDCSASKSPFINRCGRYDQAGVILQHIYGALNAPRDPGSISGTIKSYDQTTYTSPSLPGALSLGRNGYVFVPKDCETVTGPACRVHIVLHGCEQNAESVGHQVVEKTSFNAWADTNRIIVLYPQTTARALWLPLEPYNPLGCWDWWGYLSGDNSYATKSGGQIRVIKSMLDALTAGYRAESDVAAREKVPNAPVINDTSDTAVALAWKPISNATAYRVSRAGADGRFAPVGSIATLSFADTGLAPQSSYRWRLTAIINGAEGPTSAEVTATTRARPPRCKQPGQCPIATPTK